MSISYDGMVMVIDHELFQSDQRLNLAKSQPDDDTIVRGQVIGWLICICGSCDHICTPCSQFNVSGSDRRRVGG